MDDKSLQLGGQGPKRELPVVGALVYDREAQEMRPVTIEGQALMREVHGKIMQAQFTKCMGLCMVRDNRLFTQIGYETFKEYVESEWDFGLRQAYRYAQIGEKIRLMITAAESSDDVDSQQVVSLLGGMGGGHWRQLTLIADEDLKKLATSDEYTGPDGSVFTLAQLADMSTKELKEQLKRVREKATTADEQLKLKDEEIAELRATIGDDPTAAGEMVVRLKTLQAEIDILRGAARKREQATADVNEATAKIEEGLKTLRKYEAHNERDFEDAVLAEVMAEVAGRSAAYASKFGDISSRYVRKHGDWSGERT